MIELNSIMIVFMVEALVALLLLVFAFFLINRNKSVGEQIASNKVIDKLQDTENIKVKKLTALISSHCNLEPNKLNNVLAEIKSSERHLYKQIIHMFLSRDAKVLGAIDKYIDNLSEPYCKLLTYSSESRIDTDKTEAVEDNLQQLKRENQQLGEQLSIAMNTMDEISAEYSRVFGGSQTELELENSSKKMFEIFHQAEQKIKATTYGSELNI